MVLSIIAAFDLNYVIGSENKLPWHLPADLKLFKSTTMGHHVIMGRNTFESIGKPLQGRIFVVITSKEDYHPEGVLIANSLSEAIKLCGKDEEVFIIGGGQVFSEAINIADRLYITLIHHHFEGDTYFPELNLDEWKQVMREDMPANEKNAWPYSFILYERITI